MPEHAESKHLPRAGDPLDILLAHDHWGTRTLLAHCRALTREQFHRKFPMGPAERGGLHLTFTHIISAMGRWADRITGKQPVRAALEPFPWAPPPGQALPDVKDRCVDELLAVLEKHAADLRDAAKFSREREPEGLGSVMTMRTPTPQPGGLSEERTITRAGALVHVLTHGSWHRAQCMNIIRQLGVAGVSDKLPDLQVVEWQLMGEPGLQ